MDESTGDSRDEETIGNLELDSMVDLLVLGREHASELLSLGDGSGESVEDESGGERMTKKGWSSGWDGGRSGRGEAKGRTRAGTPCFPRAVS